MFGTQVGQKLEKLMSCDVNFHMLKYQFLEVQKGMTPLDRAQKSGQELGMVWYVSIKTSWDMKDRKFIKSEKGAESAK